jgi:hypothetical protein
MKVFKTKISRATMIQVGTILKPLLEVDSSTLATDQRLVVRLAQATLQNLQKNIVVAYEFGSKPVISLNMNYAEALAFHYLVSRSAWAKDLFIVEILDGINKQVIETGHYTHKYMLGA